MDITRREVNKSALWAMPVVLAAVSAPAAQGSQTPTEPPICIDPVGLSIKEEEQMPWKGNNGNGFTLVEGDTILIGNEGPADEITVTITAWTSAHQEGIRLATHAGDTLMELPKDGNRASVDIVIEQDMYRYLTVVAPSKDAEAHVIVGCRRGFVLKSAWGS